MTDLEHAVADLCEQHGTENVLRALVPLVKSAARDLSQDDPGDQVALGLLENAAKLADYAAIDFFSARTAVGGRA